MSHTDPGARVGTGKAEAEPGGLRHMSRRNCIKGVQEGLHGQAMTGICGKVTLSGDNSRPGGLGEWWRL